MMYGYSKGARVQDTETSVRYRQHVSKTHLFIMKTRLFKYIETLTSKNWKFSDKNSDIFHISAQNIDCGYSLEPPRRGGSNEYPQSMCLSKNKKNNGYPCKPQFYYIKVGIKGAKLYRHVFVMTHLLPEGMTCCPSMNSAQVHVQ